MFVKGDLHAWTPKICKFHEVHLAGLVRSEWPHLKDRVRCVGTDEW